MAVDADTTSGQSSLRVAEGGRRNTNTHLMPATFEERGSAVPFTTPALLHTRVCKDWRGRLELRLGNFAGTDGLYVIPWGALNDLIALTSHDQLLLQAVDARGVLDPHGVRLAALDVARTGLAGPEVADAAERALRSDEDADSLHQVLLILQLVSESSNRAVSELMSGVKTTEGQARIRKVLDGIGAQYGMSERELDERIAALGHATYTLGFAWSPDHGRFRVILNRLIDFEASLRSWCQNKIPEIQDQALFAATVASHTITAACETLQRYDTLTFRPVALLSPRNGLGEEVTGMARRMTWLLDGWENIVDGWFLCPDDTEHKAYLARIVPVLPFVPRDEVATSEARMSTENLVRSSRRWIRANTDWRTGEVDFDLVRRIEASRALAR